MAMDEFVLDASAILAYMRDETGADQVRAAAQSACVSTVNLAEVGSRLTHSGSTIEDARMALDALPSRFIAFDQWQAMEAARLRPLTAGLSLGDRACLALALSLGVPAMTSDQRWADVDVGVQIVLIR